MGYEYIATTEVKGVADENVATEVAKLMKLRCVCEIKIEHVGNWIYNITCKKVTCKNEEHGVTY